MKPPKSIRRIKKKIGDIIEIPTSNGLAYAQYIHEHSSFPKFGSLIRVLQGFYKKRPLDYKLEEIVKYPHRFQTFCAVHYVVSIGDWKLVGNFPVPDFAQKFPIFKSSNNSPKTPQEEAIWWLWDGEKSWKVGKLSGKELLIYPEKAVYNGKGLTSAIEHTY